MAKRASLVVAVDDKPRRRLELIIKALTLAMTLATQEDTKLYPEIKALRDETVVKLLEIDHPPEIYDFTHTGDTYFIQNKHGTAVDDFGSFYDATGQWIKNNGTWIPQSN